MATGTGTRVAIWVIAVVMAIGSVGAYFLIILENEDQKKAQAEQQVQQQKLQERQMAQAEPLSGYSAAAFAAGDITKLDVKELKAGTGEAVKADAQIEANYFGWLPDGTIFDSTNRAGNTEPIVFPLSGVIKGWSEGLVGVKQGSVVQLSIPAAQAYGEAGSPPTIPANTPLRFVIEVTKSSV